MEEKILSNDVAKEVFTIILYSDEYIQNKIPEDVLKKIANLAADSNLEIHLDKTKKLQDQNLSSDALDTFSLLYYLYVADGDERNEILSNWTINDSTN